MDAVTFLQERLRMSKSGAYVPSLDNTTEQNISDVVNVIETWSENNPIDVAPVVHGRWIKNNNSLQTDDYYCCYFDYHCSECGKVVNNRYELPKYCPNCGAKMNGGADNEM